jgi:AraC-like DNA-binding protein
MSDPGTRWEYGTNMDFVGKAVETASGSKRKMVSEELENMRGPDGLQMAQQQDGGLLSKDVLGRIRDYIMAHPEEPMEVATLAAIAGRSPFHFTRIFARNVGVTPHHYIVHLRLQCAIEPTRLKHGLAEIALRTGFSDQSRLTRWTHRVHGASLTQLVSR